MKIREAKLSDYDELMKLYNLFYYLPPETGKYTTGKMIHLKKF